MHKRYLTAKKTLFITTLFFSALICVPTQAMDDCATTPDEPGKKTTTTINPCAGTPSTLTTRKKRGLTALHVAMLGNYVSLIKQFLNDGCQGLACSDITGQNPFHIGALRGHNAAIETALNLCSNTINCSLNATDKIGLTPLDYATLMWHEATYNLLEKHGAQHSPDFEERAKQYSPIAPRKKILSQLLDESELIGRSELESAQETERMLLGRVRDRYAKRFSPPHTQTTLTIQPKPAENKEATTALKKIVLQKTSAPQITAAAQPAHTTQSQSADELPKPSPSAPTVAIEINEQDAWPTLEESRQRATETLHQQTQYSDHLLQRRFERWKHKNESLINEAKLKMGEHLAEQYHAARQQTAKYIEEVCCQLEPQEEAVRTILEEHLAHEHAKLLETYRTTRQELLELYDAIADTASPEPPAKKRQRKKRATKRQHQRNEKTSTALQREIDFTPQQEARERQKIEDEWKELFRGEYKSRTEAAHAAKQRIKEEKDQERKDTPQAIRKPPATTQASKKCSAKNKTVKKQDEAVKSDSSCLQSAKAIVTRMIGREPEKTTPPSLHTLAAQGNWQQVEERLKNAPNTQQLVLTKDRSGRTPLHHAAKSEQPQVVQTLINYARFQEQVIARDASGRTAAEITPPGDLKAFLEVTQAIAQAGRKQSQEVQELLQQFFHDKPTHPAYVATALGMNTAIEDLISFFGIDDFMHGNTTTPLHIATVFGQSETIRLLFHHGARIDKPDSQGRQAIHVATGFERVDVVNTLLKLGASANATDGKGNTPLHIAVFNNYLELVELLLDHGADSLVKNDNHNTPIMKRAEPGTLAERTQLRIAKLLYEDAIKRGAIPRP